MYDKDQYKDEEKKIKKKRNFWPYIIITAIIICVLSVMLWYDSSINVPVDAGDICVFIDPGHGSDQSPGAVYEDVFERELNLQIAEVLENILKERGYNVIMSRGEENIYVSPSQRAQMANDANADIFVSIHQNSVDGNKEVNGIETWYSKENNKESERLAKCIQKALIDGTGAKDRGIKYDTELTVTNLTQMPSVLIETGFITNDEERNKLKSSEYREKLAYFIANGINDFWGIKNQD